MVLVKVQRRFTRIYWKNLFFPGKLGKIPARYILRELPSNPVIVDAGAHIGIDSQYFASKFPQGQIFSVEPVNEIFQALSIRMNDYKNSTLVKVGLAKISGIASINLSSGESDASSSLLVPKDHLAHHPNVYFKDSEQIEVQTLDDFIAFNGIKMIDLLWLDLQGMEPAVLRASPSALKKIRLIHTEVSFVETYQGVELFREFNSFFVSHGFKLLKLNKDFRDMGNALYLNSKFDSGMENAR
jgi:FkbM family methyltransferase